MDDQMPDFEGTSDPVVPAPKKPRRKPMKRTKAPKRRKQRAVKVARRGRPPGVANKSKLVVDTSSVATIISVHAQIEESLSRLSSTERKAMLECLK